MCAQVSRCHALRHIQLSSPTLERSIILFRQAALILMSPFFEIPRDAPDRCTDAGKRVIRNRVGRRPARTNTREA